MAPKKNVVVNEELLSQYVKFRQGNPKAPGSKSFKRYERYKKAAQLGDVLKLGGSRADIKNDVEKGFVTFDRQERMVTRRNSQKRREDEAPPTSSRSGRRRPADRRKYVEEEDEATDEDDIIVVNPKEEEDEEDDGGSSSSSSHGGGRSSDEEEAVARRRPKRLASGAAVQKKKPGRKRAVDSLLGGSQQYASSSSVNLWFVEIVAREEGEESEFARRSETLGPFTTKKEAAEAALAVRNGEACFAGWAEKFYGEEDPPFDSADGPDASRRRVDLNVSLVSQKEREIARMKVEKSASASLARARARPHVKLPEVTPGSDLGFDDSLEADDGYDWARFSRTPADPELGGRQHAPNLFRPSFLRAMCRISNACYAVSAFVSNQDLGFRYALGTFGEIPERVFVPPPGHYRGGSRAPPPEKILDAVHTDLFSDPSNCPGPCSLDPERLRVAVERKRNSGAQLTHLFVLGLLDEDGLTQAILKAGSSLQVVCLAECAVSHNALAALADQHRDLRAIHLHKCHSPLDSGGDRDDEAWENLVKSAERLAWCHASYSSLADGPGFGVRAWSALAHKEHLKVLGYECDNFSKTAFQGRGLEGCINLLKPTLDSVVPTLLNLRYIYAFPDDQANSRISLDPYAIHSVLPHDSHDSSFASADRAETIAKNTNKFGFYYY